MEITLYTTNCPQCKMLEAALKNKGLSFNTVYGEEEIINRGFHSAPILEADGEVMSFAEAVRWVNGLESIPVCASCAIGGDVNAG